MSTIAAGKMLVDTLPVRLQLTEDADGEGKVVVRGEFGRVGVPTNNGRVYPRELIEREINRLSGDLNERKVLGELDHPQDGRTKLGRVSHIVTSLKIDGNRVIGEAEILDTDAGKNLKEIIKAGAQVGVSSRGVGSTQPDPKGNEIVQEDFKLATYDFVAEPAVETAYPEVFVEEDEMSGEAWTVEKLREKFPGLTKQIEEEGQEIGQEKAEKTFQSVLDEKAEDLAEQKVDELRDQIHEEETQKIREDLKDEFAMSLVGTLDDLRSDIEEQVRSEMQSDPEMAKGMMALDKVVDAVSPLVRSPEAEEVAQEKDEKIEQIRKEAEKARKRAEKLENDRDSWVERSKELGFRLYLEQRVADHKQADMIRQMVGDVTQFETIDDLEDKVSTCIETVEKEQARAEKAQEMARAEQKATENKIKKIQDEVSEKLSGLRDEIERLREENETLRHSQEDALGLAQEAALKAYAERQLNGHPRASKGRRLIESAAPKTTEEVDQILGELGPPPADDLDVRERVRRRMGRGQETLTEDERRRQEQMSSEVMDGVTMDDLRKLSGIDG